MTGLRVAVVGARTRRQGTGPYVARALARTGCQVVAVVGSSSETVREAREQLARDAGISCRGYVDLAELLAAEAPDVVAICSPAEHHGEVLTQLAPSNCHVFCEKPLFWDDTLATATLEQIRERARRLMAPLARADRVFALNTQWVYALDAYDRLFRDVRDSPLAELVMELSPATSGQRAAVESIPHLLSVLRALAGPGGIENPRLDEYAEERMTVSFDYRHVRGRAAVELRLQRTAAQPRPFALAINGHRVERRIEMPGYRMSFVNGTRQVPLPDPLVVSVERFVEAIVRGEGADADAIVEPFVQLLELVRVTAPAHSTEEQAS